MHHKDNRYSENADWYDYGFRLRLYYINPPGYLILNSDYAMIDFYQGRCPCLYYICLPGL